MHVWIGTSGYSYPDWVGPFYPPGTRPERMLAYYTRCFPLVELNFTFYRLPAASQLARIAEHTPAGFQFVVKLHRTLSHDTPMGHGLETVPQRGETVPQHDLAAFRAAVTELDERGRLAGLLCQLPQAVHDEPQHRRWLETLARTFAGCRLAVEFRHRSWFRPDVPDWLRAHDLDLVAVDVPDLPGLYPRGLVQSSPRLYVRFHSRNAAAWYGSDKERYDYDYDYGALVEWVEALAPLADRNERVLLLFNNCHRGQAAENARRMRELLARLAPELTVVEPFADPPGPRQRSLFGEDT
jgi:uncharacterized protein YecE (DUF72 family)